MADAAPTVVSRSPAAGAIGVSLYSVVRARFSEPVWAVGTSTVALRDASTGAFVGSTVRYDAASHVAVLDPSGALRLGRWYRATLSGSIHDATGHSLKTVSWTFRTAASQVFNPQRTVSFAAGSHTGYRFSPSGAVLGHKASTLAHGSSAPTGKRSLIAGHSGVWYAISSAIWAGYWVQASNTVVLH
jgi:hypothetical protein